VFFPYPSSSVHTGSLPIFSILTTITHEGSFSIFLCQAFFLKTKVRNINKLQQSKNNDAHEIMRSMNYRTFRYLDRTQGHLP
jgi:hypothetical protein